MKLTKYSLLIASALLLVACDSDSSSTTKAAKAKSLTSNKSSTSQKSVIASAKPAAAPAADAVAPAAAPQLVEMAVVTADAKVISNLDSYPYGGMDAVTSDTINNHSTYYTYICEGREYNLAKIQLPENEELNLDSTRVWAVMVRVGDNFAAANEQQFNLLMDTLKNDESRDGERFASQLKRHDIKAFDADVFAQINDRVGTKTMVAVVDNSVETELYNKGRIQGNFPVSDGSSILLQERLLLALMEPEYTVVGIETDTVVDGILPWGIGNYNQRVYAPAKVVRNLYRYEYAPLSTAEADALVAELNAAIEANENDELRNRNTMNAETFSKIMKSRNVDINSTEIRNPAYTVRKKVTAPAAAVVEVTSNN